MKAKIFSGLMDFYDLQNLPTYIYTWQFFTLLKYPIFCITRQFDEGAVKPMKLE